MPTDSTRSLRIHIVEFEEHHWNNIMPVKIERLYDFKKRIKKKSEYVLLVDRVWPRGVSKDDLPIDEWLKEIAPSTQLRKWFGHDPKKWDKFRSKYTAELQSKTDEIKRLRQLAKSRSLILLFGAKDRDHNQAAVLKELITD